MMAREGATIVAADVNVVNVQSTVVELDGAHSSFFNEAEMLIYRFQVKGTKVINWTCLMWSLSTVC